MHITQLILCLALVNVLSVTNSMPTPKGGKGGGGGFAKSFGKISGSLGASPKPAKFGGFAGGKGGRGGGGGGGIGNILSGVGQVVSHPAFTGLVGGLAGGLLAGGLSAVNQLSAGGAGGQFPGGMAGQQQGTDQVKQMFMSTSDDGRWFLWQRMTPNERQMFFGSLDPQTQQTVTALMGRYQSMPIDQQMAAKTRGQQALQGGGGGAIGGAGFGPQPNIFNQPPLPNMFNQPPQQNAFNQVPQQNAFNQVPQQNAFNQPPQMMQPLTAPQTITQDPNVQQPVEGSTEQQTAPPTTDATE